MFMENPIKIAAADSARHGLPAAAIELDTSEIGFIGSAFPADGVYLSLSGPPGGPLGLALEAYKGIKDAKGLEAFAAKRYAGDTYVRKGPGTVELAGGRRIAFTCGTGRSLARSTQFLALVPEREGADAGVLVSFYFGTQGEFSTPEEVMKPDELGKGVLGSLRVRFE
jgi:hypothetical protein